MSSNLIALQNKFLGVGNSVYDLLSRTYEEQGFIDDATIEHLARKHSLPPQQVRATAKFYENLSHDKPAKHVVKLCNGEACRCEGFADKERALQANFGVSNSHDVSSKGVRLEHVTCLGLCGLGPNAMVDGKVVSMAADNAVQAIIDAVNEKTPLALATPVNTLHFPAKGQPCIVMRNMRDDVLTLEKAQAKGIYGALTKALKEMTPEQVRAQIKVSNLRGRGGAGFPAGVKLDTVANSPSKDGRKFVCVNADEGDAGSYIDKEIMERDPHSMIEGTLLAAYACGAQTAYFYIRFEYPTSHITMQAAIDEAYSNGLAGQNILGSDFSCELKIIKGQGAYICGEETSLLRSIEGVPAQVSYKPPFPAVEGLWGCPTAVNNVETLHNLPWIINNGGDAYDVIGYERSRGTKAITVNSRLAKPGVYEVPLGTTIRQVMEMAGGMAAGHKFKAVQVGGPLGGIFPERLLDTPLDFDAMSKAKGLLGHGGMIVYSDKDDLIEIGRWLMEFCAIESCGKCFPCRIGAVRGEELIGQMMGSGVTDEKLSLLAELCETMKYGSLCALGGAIPTPIECLMEYFPEEFGKYRAKP